MNYYHEKQRADRLAARVQELEERISELYGVQYGMAGDTDMALSAEQKAKAALRRLLALSDDSTAEEGDAARAQAREVLGQ